MRRDLSPDPPKRGLAAIRGEPGLSLQRLAGQLGASRCIARRYADEVPGIVLLPRPRGALTCHLLDGVREAGDTSRVTPLTEADLELIADRIGGELLREMPA